MLLDPRIVQENEIDDISILVEPRMGESLVSIELPPEDGSVRVRDRSRHESSGRIVLSFDGADSASERDVIRGVVLSQPSEDHIEPRFPHPSWSCKAAKQIAWAESSRRMNNFLSRKG